ncbi:MAG: glycosyltransferase family 2 protein [Methanocorpusculum sp.]|nr:glycosyltransferase family 2 protein [Methanocorpusculum sp.]
MVAMPAYNEERRVGETVAEVKPYADVVVVVDDGSSDQTVDVSEKAGAMVIRHSINRGYGGALRTIFRTAKKYQPDILIIIDSDGQHNPKDIPRFVEKIQEGYDVVIGSRFLHKESQKKIPGYRRLGMKVLDHATDMALGNVHVTDSQSGFRAYARDAYKGIHISGDGMSAGSEILVQLCEQKLNIGEIPISVRYDLEDTSSQNPVRHGLSVLSRVVQIISFKKPVCVFGIPGLVFVVIGIILAVRAFEIVASTGIWATNVTLLSALLILIGLLMCMVTLMMYFILEMFGDLRRSVS